MSEEAINRRPGLTRPDAETSPSVLEAWLREVPFFTGLSAGDLREIAAAGSITELPAGHPIFREGDPADRLYVILAGQARIFKTDPEGRELTLARPTVGEFFGEMALLDGGRRSAGVVTVADCRFFTLDRAHFLGTVARHPDLLPRLMTALTAKIRERGNEAIRQEVEAERFRVEEELQRHRSLSQLVAGVAHELNTPLGIARTAASVLRKLILEPDAPDPVALPVEDIREAVDLLDRNILRAHGLVQDFKAVSVGQLTGKRESHDLVEVVGEVVNLYQVGAKRAKLDIRLEDRLGDGDRTWVGYRGYLTQVILNLLTNVERHAYPQGEGGRVEVRVSAGGDARDGPYLITVRDHGAGIPPDRLGKVFEPFYTTGRGRGGTGLGLAIVHNLVTGGLGGTVRIESEPGGGTAVHVSLPRVGSG